MNRQRNTTYGFESNRGKYDEVQISGYNDKEASLWAHGPLGQCWGAIENFIAKHGEKY